MIAAPSLRVEPSGTCAWTRVAEGTVSTRAAADWQIWRSPASPIGTSGMQGERARPRVMGRLHFHGRAPVSVDRLRHGVGPGDALEVGAGHGLVGRDSARDGGHATGPAGGLPCTRRGSVNSGRGELPVWHGGGGRSPPGWTLRLRPCWRWLTLTPACVCSTWPVAREARPWTLPVASESRGLW